MFFVAVLFSKIPIRQFIDVSIVVGFKRGFISVLFSRRNYFCYVEMLMVRA